MEENKNEQPEIIENKNNTLKTALDDSNAPEGSSKTFVSKRPKKSHSLIFIKFDKNYMTFDGVAKAAKFLNITQETVHCYCRRFKADSKYKVFINKSEILTDLFITFKEPTKLNMDYHDYIRAMSDGLRLMKATEEQITEAINNVNISLKPTPEQTICELIFEIKDRPDNIDFKHITEALKAEREKRGELTLNPLFSESNRVSFTTKTSIYETDNMIFETTSTL